MHSKDAFEIWEVTDFIPQCVSQPSLCCLFRHLLPCFAFALHEFTTPPSRLVSSWYRCRIALVDQAEPAVWRVEPIKKKKRRNSKDRLQSNGSMHIKRASFCHDCVRSKHNGKSFLCVGRRLWSRWTDRGRTQGGTDGVRLPPRGFQGPCWQKANVGQNHVGDERNSWESPKKSRQDSGQSRLFDSPAT